MELMHSIMQFNLTELGGAAELILICISIFHIPEWAFDDISISLAIGACIHETLSRAIANACSTGFMTVSAPFPTSVAPVSFLR